MTTHSWLFQNHFHQNKDWNMVMVLSKRLTTFISEPLPSKQGLKLKYLMEIHLYYPKFQNHFHQNKDWNQISSMSISNGIGNFRTTSIKTRIETFMGVTSITFWTSFQNHFHQNKDWNPSSFISKSLAWLFQNHFHQNKDWNADGSELSIECNFISEPLPSKQGLKL